MNLKKGDYVRSKLDGNVMVVNDFNNSSVECAYTNKATGKKEYDEFGPHLLEKLKEATDSDVDDIISKLNKQS